MTGEHTDALSGMVSLIAGVLVGCWRHSTRQIHRVTGEIVTREQFRVLPKDTQREYRKEWVVELNDSAATTGDSALVISTANEISLVVLGKCVGDRSDGSTIWAFTKLNPVTGESDDGDDTPSVTTKLR